jgi:hypothetical protein
MATTHLYHYKKHWYFPRSSVTLHKQERTSLNDRIALWLTKNIGTMVCAYLFAALAICGFPGFHATTQQYVQWLSQTFIQLTMLSVIMVGQRVMGRAQELQAEETYKASLRICHDNAEILQHMREQDTELLKQSDMIAQLLLLAQTKGGPSMPDDVVILPAPVGHITEFVPNSRTGDLWRGACGETALAIAEKAARGEEITADDIDQLTQEMIDHGEALPNGASWIYSLANHAREQGYSVIYEHDYAADLWDEAEWHQLLLDHAGIHPIVMQVAHAWALTDVQTGSADEAGVLYHVICIVGKESDGYIVADGDNPQANERFQIYDLKTLERALPCGALILDMQRAAEMKGVTMLTANGWTWTDNKLTHDATHVSLEEGFALWGMNNPRTLETFGDPLMIPTASPDTFGYGPGAYVVFQYAALCWTSSKNVFGVSLGEMYQWFDKKLQEQTPPAPVVDPKAKQALDILTAFHSFFQS